MLGKLVLISKCSIQVIYSSLSPVSALTDILANIFMIFNTTNFMRQHRQQNGLPIKASMGVCIQRMVNADAAGVMFTRHPTTGDPSSILITSNYGLGEVRSVDIYLQYIL